MPNEFTMSTILPATPEQIFRAWLSTEGHTAMTDSPAKVESRVGGKFSAWDGYISGQTLKLKQYTYILQSWRTTEFPQGSPDSQVKISLESAPGGTKITLTHQNIPEGQAKSYKQGWKDFYFKPMKEYFANSRAKRS
jgi:activator of HSP90 ATPase